MSCQLADWVTPAALISGSITADDYPSRAVRDELEGTTRLRFTVSVEGRAEDVQVVASSGHAILDDASIKLVQGRFRYRPTLDEKGQPVNSQLHQTIRWAL